MLGLSQAELGSAVGCSQSALSRLENGQIDAISEEVAQALCGTLGIDPKLYQPNEVTFCCTNPTCPQSHLYLINGSQVACRPWTMKAQADSTPHCPACGGVMSSSCLDPKCRAPLVPGHAFCTKCGQPYAEFPRDWKQPADPKKIVIEHEQNKKRFNPVQS